LIAKATDYWKLIQPRDPSLVAVPMRVSVESTTPLTREALLATPDSELPQYWDAIEEWSYDGFSHSESNLCRVLPHSTYFYMDGLGVRPRRGGELSKIHHHLPAPTRLCLEAAGLLAERGVLPSYIWLDSRLVCLADWLLDLVRESLPPGMAEIFPLHPR
jgi:hypothetical protein